MIVSKIKNILLLTGIICLLFVSCKQKTTINTQSINKTFSLINPNISYTTTINNKSAILNINQQSDTISAILFFPNEINPFDSMVLLEGNKSNNYIELLNTENSIIFQKTIDESNSLAKYKNLNTLYTEDIILEVNSKDYSNGNLKIISSDSTFIKNLSLTGLRNESLLMGELLVLKRETSHFTLLFQYPSHGVFKAKGACGMGVEMLLAEIEIVNNEELRTKYTELESCNNGIESTINDEIVTFDDIKTKWIENKTISLQRTELRKDKTTTLVIN